MDSGGIWMWDSGGALFKVQSSKFKVQSSRFKTSRFGVQSSKFRVRGSFSALWNSNFEP
jgi:hypothetical protein